MNEFNFWNHLKKPNEQHYLYQCIFRRQEQSVKRSGTFFNRFFESSRKGPPKATEGSSVPTGGLPMLAEGLMLFTEWTPIATEGSPL